MLCVIVIIAIIVIVVIIVIVFVFEFVWFYMFLSFRPIWSSTVSRNLRGFSLAPSTVAWIAFFRLSMFSLDIAATDAYDLQRKCWAEGETPLNQNGYAERPKMSRILHGSSRV